MKFKALYAFLFVSLALVAGSCKKSDTPKYYVKVVKNGVQLSYPVATGEYGPDLGDPSLTDLIVRGQSASGDEILDIVIQVTGTLSPGTYTTGSSSYQTNIDLFLNPNPSTLYHYDVSDAPGLASSSYSVTITSVSNELVTGTFTGNYLYNSFGSGTNDVINLTSGEFRIKPIY